MFEAHFVEQRKTRHLEQAREHRVRSKRRPERHRDTGKKRNHDDHGEVIRKASRDPAVLANSPYGVERRLEMSECEDCRDEKHGGAEASEAYDIGADNQLQHYGLHFGTSRGDVLHRDGRKLVVGIEQTHDRKRDREQWNH